MKWLLSSIIFCLAHLPSFAQELLSEAEKKIIQNQYGELYYGNKQFSISSFYIQDSLKYLYSKPQKKIFVLDKENKIIAEKKIKFKDFSLPHFTQSGEQVLLSVFGEDESRASMQNIQIVKEEIKKPKKIIAQKSVFISPNATFVAQQLLISPSKTLSKVLLYKSANKVDTLYKDTKTKENRTVNTSPRAELVVHNNKVYFFNADQRLLLIYSLEGKLIETISLKEQEDEYIKTFIINFLLDTKTGQMYVSTVQNEQTYLYEIGSQGIKRRYEIPFRMYIIHQIYDRQLFFSMNTEEKNYYIYKRNL